MAQNPLDIWSIIPYFKGVGYSYHYYYLTDVKMSTPINAFTPTELAKEIQAIPGGEDVTSGLVGNILRKATKSARVSALIAQAEISLTAKAKAERKARKPRKVAA